MKKISILFIVLVLLLTLPLVSAEKVGIGIYVLNLGKFDVSTGAFTADFYLSVKCESECSDFEFMNGRAASTDKIIDTPHEKFYRILGNFNSPVDLRKFPFDKQKMQIILEDKRNTIEDLRYIPLKSESGIDNSIVFTGWNIDSWNTESKMHVYDIYNETYSQYIFTIKISRIFINSFFKTFLPVLFIILILLFSFIMDPDKITTRIAMSTSSLIASVMFHISISNQIPPVGYLTSADKFMILTYFIILISVILNVTLLDFTEHKKTDIVEKIHRTTEYSMLIIVPFIYLLFFVFFI